MSKSNRQPELLRRQLSRRRLFAIGGVAVGSTALAQLLAACGGGGDDTSGATATSPGGANGGASTPGTGTNGDGTGGGPRQGGELIVGFIQEPDSLNPWMSGLNVALEIENTFYEQLTRVTPEGDHVPALAKEVPSLENGGISEDLKTYTYRLREDVTWHDGEPFTADDVVFTYNAIADPTVNARSRTGFELIESVEATDPHTVVFRLNRPSGAFLETFAYRGILPKHMFEGQDMNTTELNIRPTVGNGPYKFVEWVSGDRVVVERNENYYREGGYLDRIIFRFVPNSDTLMTMLETGEIDMRFVLTAEHVPLARQLPDYEVFATPAHSYFHFTINVDDPILGDRLVRQALSYGLDKQEITETVLQGLVEPHWSPIAQPCWAFVDPAEKMSYDPARAAELLDQAGWTMGGGGIREKDGQRLTINLMNIAGDSERLQVVQLVQAMWKELGAEVNIDAVDAATFVSKSTARDFQIAYGFWSFSSDPSGYNERFLSTSVANWMNYHVPEVDRLLLEGEATLDREARKELYAQFQEIVINDVPSLPLYNRVFFDVVKKRVRGFVPNSSNSTNMWNVHEWWVEE